jgi:RHS repeat-associated protein
MGAQACGTRFGPFGDLVGLQSATACTPATSPNSYLYRGTRRDGTTTAYQFGSRTYDPTKASFLTPDTYRVADSGSDLSLGTDSLTQNRYSYVNGDPVNLVDPDGHHADCEYEFARDRIGRQQCLHKDAQGQDRAADYAARRASIRASVKPLIDSVCDAAGRQPCKNLRNRIDELINSTDPEKTISAEQLLDAIYGLSAYVTEVKPFGPNAAICGVIGFLSILPRHFSWHDLEVQGAEDFATWLLRVPRWAGVIATGLNETICSAGWPDVNHMTIGPTVRPWGATHAH